MVQEEETYQDTLLQKPQHLAEDILTRGQIIKRNLQRYLGIEEKLKEAMQAEEPDKEPSALVSSRGLAVSSDKPTSAQPSEGSTPAADKDTDPLPLPRMRKKVPGWRDQPYKCPVTLLYSIVKIRCEASCY